jgi:hypothetical protein
MQLFFTLTTNHYSLTIIKQPQFYYFCANGTGKKPVFKKLPFIFAPSNFNYSLKNYYL